VLGKRWILRRESDEAEGGAQESKRRNSRKQSRRRISRKQKEELNIAVNEDDEAGG